MKGPAPRGSAPPFITNTRSRRLPQVPAISLMAASARSISPQVLKKPTLNLIVPDPSVPRVLWARRRNANPLWQRYHIFVQFVAYLVAVHLSDGDGYDAGPVFHIAAAVQLYLVYFSQPLQHEAGQLFFMLLDTVDTRVQDEFDPFIQAGDAGRIQGPALIAVRQKIRLVQAFGKAARPPFLQCVQGYPLAHIQAAGALRSQETLVPRKSK